MEGSRTRPGGFTPRSPVGSVESLAANTSAPQSRTGSPAAREQCEHIGNPEPGRSGNVMITLSLTPDSPPTSTPSRPSLPRSHIRSRSLADDPGMPVMIRAHSSPGLDSRGRYTFVSGRGAPMNTAENATKRYLPLQLSTSAGDSLEPRMLHRKNLSETISEHAELDTSGSPASNSDYHPSSPVPSHTTPRIGRRRPSSPLHFPQSPSSQVTSSPFGSANSSPTILSSRFNEAFPSYSASSASSMPSTPTSLRSRSPSISSLETIPDIPDAEAEALESDRIADLKAAADRADDADAAGNVSRRRGISDMSGPSSSARAGGGFRKRWSVCGAERRQDLDLETIWED
ncbi:hypothetical protein BDV18DRAFT_130828 [Aspergillus unguis]